MKILKKLGFILLTLVALFFIIPLFVDGEYSVRKSVEINKPKQEVFNYVKYLKNQDEYSVWAQKDPNMKKSYKGEDGEVGFISAWDSKDENVGVGEQEIVAIDEGKKISYELRFKKPFEAKDNAYISTTAINSSKTKVTWGFDGKMDYPMNIFMLFMDMEGMLGPDLQNGLDNMKLNLESGQE